MGAMRVGCTVVRVLQITDTFLLCYGEVFLQTAPFPMRHRQALSSFAQACGIGGQILAFFALCLMRLFPYPVSLFCFCPLHPNNPQGSLNSAMLEEQVG